MSKVMKNNKTSDRDETFKEMLEGEEKLLYAP